MEYKPLPIGVDNFEKLIKNGYYYVDKTAFIKDLIDQKGDVNLFTRPRRFGKTLNMSMMRYFFEDMCTAKGELIDNSGIFEKLSIMQTGEKYLSYMGKYPVITLTLKAGKQSTFERAYYQLCWQVSMEFDRHRYLLDSDMADEALRQIEDRNYEKELIDDNYSLISRHGISFCGKECMVKLAAGRIS